MTYIIPLENREELKGRLEYLYDVFNLYFTVKKIQDKYFYLESIPKNSLDCFFMKDHNYKVYEFLEKKWKKIKEKRIFLITCDFDGSNLKVRRKKVYIVKNKSSLQHEYNGEDYGMKFKITEFELNLFNSKKSIEERLKDFFVDIREIKNGDIRKNKFI